MDPPEGPCGTPRAFLDPPKDVCSGRSDDFCLGDLFYCYEKDLSTVNIKNPPKFFIKPSWSNGYVSGLSHDRPGFDPPMVLYKFHNFFFKLKIDCQTLIEDTQKKCKAARSGLHLHFRLLRPLTSLICNDTMQGSFDFEFENVRNRRSRFLAFSNSKSKLPCIGIVK